MVKPSLRKAMARTLVSRHGFAVRLACRTVGISTSSYYYQSKGKAEDEQIADCLIKLTQANKRWALNYAFSISEMSKALFGIISVFTASTRS